MGTPRPWRIAFGSAHRAGAHHAPPGLVKTIIEGLFRGDAAFIGGLNPAHIHPRPGPQPEFQVKIIHYNFLKLRRS